MKPRNNAVHTYLYIHICSRLLRVYRCFDTIIRARVQRYAFEEKRRERERERSGGTQCVAAKVVGARSEGIPESGGEWRDEVV